MIPQWSCFHRARFVLEAETAFSIRSGLSDGAFNTLLTRDANGLPAIPGTSLAGVLKQRLSEVSGGDAAERLFGFAEGDRGNISRIKVSWGCVHNSGNKPVEGLLAPDALGKDVLLDRLVQEHPWYRERVKINQRGVADAKEKGKFDVTVIPAGCRFSVELDLWSPEPVNGGVLHGDPDWQRLLNILKSGLRLGSSVRSGLGRFCLVGEPWVCSLNLTDEQDFTVFRSLEPSLASQKGLVALSDVKAGRAGDSQNDRTEDVAGEAEAVDKQSGGIASVSLALEPEDFWRFGHPGESLGTAQGESPDAVPLVEPKINWEGGAACFDQKYVVVPGSGVKGALAHRVRFHYHRLAGQFAGDEMPDEPFNLLFGYEKGRTETNADDNAGEQATKRRRTAEGQAGLIWFSDLYLDINPQQDLQRLTHNSLDRFTGGTRDGALFIEELLWNRAFELKLEFDVARTERLAESDADFSGQLRVFKSALKLALLDLADGRLALGAAASRGHGYFRCDDGPQWSEAAKQWMGDAL